MTHYIATTRNISTEQCTLRGGVFRPQRQCFLPRGALDGPQVVPLLCRHHFTLKNYNPAIFWTLTLVPVNFVNTPGHIHSWTVGCFLGRIWVLGLAYWGCGLICTTLKCQKSSLNKLHFCAILVSSSFLVKYGCGCENTLKPWTPWKPRHELGRWCLPVSLQFLTFEYPIPECPCR